MNARVVLALGLLALCAAMSLAAVTLSNGAEARLFAAVALVFLAAPSVGALIVAYRPGNRIGWLFLTMGIAFSTGSLAPAVAARWALAGYPAAGVAAWLSEWVFLAYWIPAGVLLLVFPTGRFMSPIWQRVGWVIALGGVTTVGGLTLGTQTFDVGGRPVPNPFVASSGAAEAFAFVSGAANILLIALLPVAAAGLVARLRAAAGIERQQVKWFVAAGTVVGVLLVVSAIAPLGVADVLYLLSVVGIGAGLPVAAGLAILRHRLYDIDVVIRRTLVYGTIVAVLGAVYVGLVVGLQSLLVGVTGGQTLPVALSTIAIAALFGPVRSRVRDVVDRRFYRSRYRADRALEAFSGRLRDEVELDAVGRLLVDAAARTVRPAAASVWIRARRAP